MTTVFEHVKTALGTLSPAVGGGGGGPTRQLIGSPDEQSADNAETQRSYLVQVTAWSRAGLASLPNVDAAMLAAGFFKRDQRQVPQDRETGHYGLATDYVYLE
jgi:hypothetical protein